MPKIIISGNIHDEDIQFIANHEELSFSLHPFIQFLKSPDSIKKLLTDAHDADLLIFRAVGDNPAQLIAALYTIGMLNDFLNIKCPKVFWSQDSHHMHPQESSVQQFFSRYYIAHHAYLDKFIPSKTSWLPCCLTSLSIPSLLSLANSNFAIDRNIIFPYRLYPNAPRNITAHKIKTILEQKSISHFFGEIASPSTNNNPWASMYGGLTSSKIILNISLMDDLNIRNFEAIAANRILLANKLPDHDLIDLDYSHTYFFKNDLSNFEEILEQALSDNTLSIQTWRSILGKHMQIDRYLEIINSELGTTFKVDIQRALDFNYKDIPGPMRGIDYSEKDTKTYSNETIATNGIFSLVNSNRFSDAISEMLNISKETKYTINCNKIIEELSRIANTPQGTQKLKQFLSSVTTVLNLPQDAAKLGDTVKVHYTCKVQDGSIVDTSLDKAPIELQLGTGQAIPDLEEAIIGMKPGESKTKKVTTEKAFGPYVKEKVLKVDKNKLPLASELKVGEWYQIPAAVGEMTDVRVTEVSEWSVTLDANHPLAGRDLFFDIQLIEIHHNVSRD